MRVDSVGGAERDTSTGVYPQVEKHYRPVIERCTYCVSYRAADRGHDVKPACAAACPMGVFAVGDAEDTESRISEILASNETVSAHPPAEGGLVVRYLLTPQGRIQRRSGGN